MKRTILATALAGFALSATADPVKCVDANGKVRYVDSSTPGTENCKPIGNEMQIVPSPSGSGAGTYTPSSRPSGGNPGEAQGRLRGAQGELAEAQRQLAEQEAIRNGGEKNYQRVLDRLKPYQDAVQRAQQNLEKAQRDAR
jgi:hypothetical protein